MSTTNRAPEPSPLQGRLDTLQLRVVDADRAARFFSALVGPESARDHADPGPEQRVTTLFTDEASAPAARLGFETGDPEAALAQTVRLGGSGVDTADVRDDQGTPLCFYAPTAVTAQVGQQTAGLATGPVIVLTRDTAKARAFHNELFGQQFQKVGSGDFWWVSSGPAFGIFPVGHDLTNPEVPLPDDAPRIQVFFSVRNLDRAIARVKGLGGTTLHRGAVGHYQVCGCRDDQGTGFGLWWDSSQ